MDLHRDALLAGLFLLLTAVISFTESVIEKFLELGCHAHWSAYFRDSVFTALGYVVIAGFILYILHRIHRYDEVDKAKETERNDSLDNIIASHNTSRQEEQERNQKLVDLIASVNRLVERMEDGKID